MATFWAMAACIGVVALAAVAAGAQRRVVVRAWETGLVYGDGRFERELAPGAHRLVDPWRRLEVATLTTGARAAQTTTIEAFSREGFAMRLMLNYTFALADPRGYYEARGGVSTPPAGGVLLGAGLPGFDEALVAATMRAAAVRPLAELLADPQPIAAEALAAVAGGFPQLVLATPTVARLTLAPEVRRLFTEVETARLQGLAALERARGEQAALRTLANAARVLRDHPELAQLRLLQTVETARKPPTIVLGTQPLGVVPATPA